MSTPVVDEDTPLFLSVTSWLYRALYVVVLLSIMATLFAGALVLSEPGGMAGSAHTAMGHTFRSLIWVVVGSGVGRIVCWMILNQFHDD
jgi:hypothetical protein